MESKPIIMPAGPEPPGAPVPEISRPDVVSRPSAHADQPDLRLIIEQDSASGQYVYKTVDRRTGDVVQQLPQDEILQMQHREAYVAGDLLRAKA